MNFVKDRAGHDLRYAPDTQKIQRELGWRPRRPFLQGLVDMVAWYRANEPGGVPLKSRRADTKRITKNNTVDNIPWLCLGSAGVSPAGGGFESKALRARRPRSVPRTSPRGTTDFF
jgi:hypothetical protein